MTTMAYIIAGLCIILAVAGILWYAFMMRDDETGSKNQDEPASTDNTEEE